MKDIGYPYDLSRLMDPLVDFSPTSHVLISIFISFFVKYPSTISVLSTVKNTTRLSLSQFSGDLNLCHAMILSSFQLVVPLQQPK